MSELGSLSGVPLASLIEDGVQRRICAGKLLLRVRLAGDEVASLAEPAPLFRLASRLSYLPLFFSDVFEYFKSYLPPLLGQSYEIWFDHNGVPLRWHYPLGVLCDVLLGSEVQVPWDLTVHFRGCPSKELLAFSGMGDLKSAVMSAFRQAVFLQQASPTPWSRLPMQQQQRLWDAIKAVDLDGCSQVQQQLICQTLAKCKSLAVRMHICGGSLSHTVLLHTAPPIESDGQVLTLLSFLCQVLPPVIASAEASEDGTGKKELAQGVEVLTHGLRIPLATPMYWLALHAAHLDNFVHLVVRLQNPAVVSSLSQDDQSPAKRGMTS